MFDANFLINQENKSNNKKKKSILICTDFNVTFKKFSGDDTPGTPSKDRPMADRRALRARFVKTQRHLPNQTFLDPPLKTFRSKVFV